jgi:hypothetical protein
MVLAGVDPDTAKIIVDGKVTDHVSALRYLGCKISYRKNIDVKDKPNRFRFF